MKKYYILLALSAVCTAFAGAVCAAPTGISYGILINPNAAVGETPRYVMSPTAKRPTPTAKFQDKYYIGARFGYTLSSFDNEYSLAWNPSDRETDSFSFAQQLGFDVTGGWQFQQKWRAELNYGNSGKYIDRDADSSFDILTQFLTLNGIYTVKEWTTTSAYIGAGVGLGVVRTAFSNSLFAHNATTGKTSIGFAGQIMVGLEEKIMDNLYLGLTYRLSYLTGHKQKIELYDGDTFMSDTGGILNNTFGVGLRFEF